MSPTDIAYPVFKINSKTPVRIDNTIVVISNMIDPDGNEIDKTRIIDDKDAPGKTLGLRRLYLANEGLPLYKLQYAIYFLGDLIKLAKADTWFIDNEGTMFRYRKEKVAKLKYYKITNVMRIATGGAIVEVAGVPVRFKVLFVPDVNHSYAGILSCGMEFIFYGFYDKKYKESWRKI